MSGKAVFEPIAVGDEVFVHDHGWGWRAARVTAIEGDRFVLILVKNYVVIKRKRQALRTKSEHALIK